eukprot:m51a1_g1517 hypothetical protein (96) ;mRNA; f:429487-429833
MNTRTSAEDAGKQELDRAAAQWGDEEDQEPAESRSPSPRRLRRRHASKGPSSTRLSLSAHLPVDIEQSLRKCGILTVSMPKPRGGIAWESMARIV